MNKAVFLDKDGTINEDLGYIDNPAKIRLIPGSAEAIKTLNQAEYKVIIVSNQAGIARGYFTEDTLQAIDKALNKQILLKGGYIDATYYCPHHPEIGIHPYRQPCWCRKPAPGMIKKAAKDLEIDLSHSYVIGDKETDIEAGKRAGCKTILVLTGYGEEHKTKLEQKNMPPDHIANTLLDAVRWMLNHE